MITTAQIIALKTSLASAITMADKENIISPARRDQMAEALTLFCIKAVAKYYKGQLEHGGDLADRQLDAEIEAEIIDLLWYHEAKKWKNN